MVRWAVDRRTAARATPVALPVGVILGLLSGARLQVPVGGKVFHGVPRMALRATRKRWRFALAVEPARSRQVGGVFAAPPAGGAGGCGLPWSP